MGRSSLRSRARCASSLLGRWPDRLDPESRDSLLGLWQTLEPDSGSPIADLHVGFITGATGMDARQFRNVTGETINFHEIQAGGD